MQSHVTIPISAVRHLTLHAAASPLRVFVAIAIVAAQSVAIISATDLAGITGLTERSVFSALAYLQDQGFIVRESRGSGRFRTSSESWIPSLLP